MDFLDFHDLHYSHMVVRTEKELGVRVPPPPFVEPVMSRGAQKNKRLRMGFPRAPPLWSVWCLVVRRRLGNIEKLMALNMFAGKCVIEQQCKLQFAMFST